MSELSESIMKIACEFSINMLDSVNMIIDEQKTKAEVSNCVDRESFNLGLSCAMTIIDMYKDGIAERYSGKEGDESEETE